MRGKRVGFSLSDIGEMLALYDPNNESREQLKLTLGKSRDRLAILRRQRQDIDEVIAELEDGCRQISDLMETQTETS